MARGVEVIERNAQTQAQLIEDILDASRVITGSLRLNRGPVDLATVIDAAADSVRLGAEAKGIQLAVILDPAARHLTGDASRLQQVVWNLLANAIKFTASGGRVEVRLQRAGGQARSRSPIPARASRPSSSPSSSTASARPTRPSRGATVAWAWAWPSSATSSSCTRAASRPRARARATAPRSSCGCPWPRRSRARGPVPPPPTANRPALQGAQILVVDDDQDALDMLTVVLTEAGAAVRTAASATEALALLRWIRPDVLVSDLAMPDEDGYSLIRNLRAIERESGRETPAVALTAYVRVQDRARAEAAGFNVFVEKPVDPEELIAVLAGIAESRGGKTPRPD